jgi:hypothetical protein
MFTENVPGMFGKNAPPVFGQYVPCMFTRTARAAGEAQAIRHAHNDEVRE